jgi:diacylglycerol kinase family enzyme
VSGANAHRRAVGFVNVSSGKASDDHRRMVDALRDAGVDMREMKVDCVGELITAAINEGAEAIVMVGGDGTQRAAAAVLVDAEIPLLPVPAGTWNHLAKTLGISDVEAAVQTVAHGEPALFPVGRVNGNCFVNTAVMGWYPELVRTRERLRTRWPRGIAALLALLRHVTTMQRFIVTIDDEQYEAWMVWVGNGIYGDGVGTLSERQWPSPPSLDVRVALAHRRIPKLRLLGDLFRGRLRASNHLKTLRAEGHANLTVLVNRRRVDVALDGEVVSMVNPLRYSTGKTVLVLRPPQTG